MVRRIIAIPNDKLDALETTRKLTAIDREVLQEFVEIMTPIEEATDRTQGENIITASTVIHVITGLRHHLNGFTATYNANLVRVLQRSLNRRLTVFEEKPIYKRAAMLDPRFKLCWCVGTEAIDMFVPCYQERPTTIRNPLR